MQSSVLKHKCSSVLKTLIDNNMIYIGKRNADFVRQSVQMHI